MVAMASTAFVALGVVGLGGGELAVAASKSPAVTAMVELTKVKVTAGKLVRGKLVLTNRGSQEVDLNQICAPKWEVVLGKGRTAPPVAVSQECGVGSFPVKPGTTRLPFETSTKKLSPGKYRAFLVASDPSFPVAKPVPVTIVAPS